MNIFLSLSPSDLRAFVMNKEEIARKYFHSFILKVCLRLQIVYLLVSIVVIWTILCSPDDKSKRTNSIVFLMRRFARVSSSSSSSPITFFQTFFLSLFLFRRRFTSNDDKWTSVGISRYRRLTEMKNITTTRREYIRHETPREIFVFFLLGISSIICCSSSSSHRSIIWLII